MIAALKSYHTFNIKDFLLVELPVWGSPDVMVAPGNSPEVPKMRRVKC